MLPDDDGPAQADRGPLAGEWLRNDASSGGKPGAPAGKCIDKCDF